MDLFIVNWGQGLNDKGLFPLWPSPCKLILCRSLDLKRCFSTFYILYSSTCTDSSNIFNVHQIAVHASFQVTIVHSSFSSHVKLELKVYPQLSALNDCKLQQVLDTNTRLKVFSPSPSSDLSSMFSALFLMPPSQGIRFNLTRRSHSFLSLDFLSGSLPHSGAFLVFSELWIHLEVSLPGFYMLSIGITLTTAIVLLYSLILMYWALNLHAKYWH